MLKEPKTVDKWLKTVDKWPKLGITLFWHLLLYFHFLASVLLPKQQTPP